MIFEQKSVLLGGISRYDTEDWNFVSDFVKLDNLAKKMKNSLTLCHFTGRRI
jgi:hypothetical protein